MTSNPTGGEGPQPNPLFVRVRDAAARLAAIGAGNPRLEAEYLMAAALSIPRIRLWLADVPPSLEQIEAFEGLLARRLAREPLQYVLGTADFAGLQLRVGPGCFIPRSETEVLVELAAEHLGRAGRPRDGVRIVDVGTGSGAILLALLARLPFAVGIGVDRSEAALRWARRNAEAVGCAARSRFVRASLLSWADPRAAFDAVISNPPYIREDEEAALAPEIADHEPREALVSGRDGLDAVRSLLPDAACVLRPGGLLGVEIGITQGDAVLALLDHPLWQDARVLPDLTGRPRVVLATRTGHAA